MGVASSVAQEDTGVDPVAVDATWAAIANPSLRYIHLDAYRSMLAAEDGNYVAQTAEELQTYNDLKMDYQYIDSQQIRKHLELSPEQGILIAEADEAGIGYAAGFRSGDLVLQVGDESVDTQYDLVIALTGVRGKETASAKVRRDGEVQQLAFTLTPVSIEKNTRWIIGVSVTEMSEVLKSHLHVEGAVVDTVSEGSPAGKMGIMVNDIISKINGAAISNLDSLRAAVHESEGNPITLELVRSGNKMTLELTPEKFEEVDGVPYLKNLPVINQFFIDSSVEHEARLLANLATDIDGTLTYSKYHTQGLGADQLDKLEAVSQQIQELQEQVRQLQKSINK